MSDTVIRAENLGKKYVLGSQRSTDLRHAVTQTLRRAVSPAIRGEDFWALADVSFEVKRGDVIGIVGRNGAGKSTLLKILSRITAPTTGRFEIDGRVSSLLEVGTGFHMELTGRENIFLNGTILGMRRAEIRNKFDEIVSFSGVEAFLDTAVKHYSSGMRVRLAFSVAAHLEPEILIIDEVLAVGDAEFQRKCLGKMNEVSKEKGRTILFVSHNLAAVEHLCSRGLLLDRGTMVVAGDVSSVVDRYVKSGSPGSHWRVENVALDNGVMVKNFELSQSVITAFDDLEYRITLASTEPNRFSELVVLVYNHLDERVGIVDLRHRDLESRSAQRQEFTIHGKLRGLPLMEGTYRCGLFVSSLLCRGDFLNIASFEVKGADSVFVPYPLRYRGYLEFDNSFVIH